MTSNHQTRQQELLLWFDYIQKICGLVLDESKGYLLDTRLADLRREMAASSLTELLERVKADASGQLRQRVIDEITTGETSFFRDAATFDLLQKHLIPKLIEQRSASGKRPVPLRIWSAGCSTGQELYSVAIVLAELINEWRHYDIQLIGTDISERALSRARRGEFQLPELQRGLTPHRILRHFFNVKENTWRILDVLRSATAFTRMNLLDPFALPCKFDIVLCRNVAIYFDANERRCLFQKIAGILAPDGALLIGSTESLAGQAVGLQPKREGQAVYYQISAQG